MKTIATLTLTIASFSLLAAATALVAGADETKATAENKTFTGTITSLDTKERTLTVKRFLFGKSFHLGDHCTVTVGDKEVSVEDLRPGQKTEVTYRDASGVLVASRVKQMPLVIVGRVEELDADKRSLRVREGKRQISFTLAEDCKFTFPGGKDGEPDAFRPGYKVTVYYEMPPGGALARRIEQQYESFTGNLTAVDAQARTLKAKHLVGTKTFKLARDCQIVLNGKTDAELDDLRLGQKFTVTFEEVDGVNVASCVTSAEATPPNSTTASAR